MRSFTYILSGRIPPKKNNRQTFVHPVTKQVVNIPSKKYQEWHKDASAQIIEQWQAFIRPLPVYRCDSIVCKIFYGDQYRKDNSNTIESIHDLLVDCKVIADDSWQVTGTTTQIPVFRKIRPGAEITINVSDEEIIPIHVKVKKTKDATKTKK